jgi:hypothetical protein
MYVLCLLPVTGKIYIVAFQKIKIVTAKTHTLTYYFERTENKP